MWVHFVEASPNARNLFSGQWMVTLGEWRLGYRQDRANGKSPLQLFPFLKNFLFLFSRLIFICEFQLSWFLSPPASDLLASCFQLPRAHTSISGLFLFFIFNNLTLEFMTLYWWVNIDNTQPLSKLNVTKHSRHAIDF